MEANTTIIKHMERSTKCIAYYTTKYGNIWKPERGQAQAWEIYKDFFMDMLDRRDDCTRELKDDPTWECPDEIEEPMGILNNLHAPAWIAE